jgi:hypothetical protein
MSGVRKFLNTTSPVALLVLLVALLMGYPAIAFSWGALIISGIWIGLTAANFGRLLHTYWSLMSRLQVRIPVVVGVLVSAGAIATSHGSPLVICLAIAELIGWALIYRRYRRNKALFEKMGHGFLPARVYLNPERELMPPGSFLLSAGDLFAPRLHSSVDHAELVIRNNTKKKTRIEALSAWIAYGTVIHLLRQITTGVRQKNGFYIGLIPKTPLTDEESDVLFTVATEMKAENEATRALWQPRIDWFISVMPLPREWKNWLTTKLQWDGYDYLGLLTGHRRKHCWTCFGATLEAWDRMCDEMEKRGRPRARLRRYGIGLLGLGTGLFDPLMVVRIMDDPELHLLNEDDQAAFRASQPAAATAPASKPTEGPSDSEAKTA